MSLYIDIKDQTKQLECTIDSLRDIAGACDTLGLERASSILFDEAVRLRNVAISLDLIATQRTDADLKAAQAQVGETLKTLAQR